MAVLFMDCLCLSLVFSWYETDPGFSLFVRWISSFPRHLGHSPLLYCLQCLVFVGFVPFECHPLEAGVCVEDTST